MKISPDKCPECGACIEGTCETLTGVALLFQNDDGTYEYNGQTDIHWNGQKTVKVGEETEVICEQGHTFLAYVSEHRE